MAPPEYRPLCLRPTAPHRPGTLGNIGFSQVGTAFRLSRAVCTQFAPYTILQFPSLVGDLALYRKKIGGHRIFAEFAQLVPSRVERALAQRPDRPQRAGYLPVDEMLFLAMLTPPANDPRNRARAKSATRKARLVVEYRYTGPTWVSHHLSDARPPLSTQVH